jgi:hypothetical protein
MAVLREYWRPIKEVLFLEMDNSSHAFRACNFGINQLLLPRPWEGLRWLKYRWINRQRLK